MTKLADYIEKEGALTPGEETLLAGLGTGMPVLIGGMSLPPEDAGPERVIRGAFLREIILGSFEGKRLHEKGVRLRGAHITGVLDLEGCRFDRDLGLYSCRFEVAPVLYSARVDSLFLTGSTLPGLEADRLEARGDVCLRKVEAKGEVRLPGAALGGQLACDGARITAGAGGKALNAEGTRIKRAFFLRNGAQVKGVLDLTDAEIGSFCDVETCWPGPGDLLLNRCRYGAFTGTGTPVEAEARIRWLDLQDPALWGDDFWPQPWEQCAQVLREMGHRGDARAVLVEKEKRQRAAARARVEALDRFRPFKEGLVAAALVLVLVGLVFGWGPGFALAMLAAPLFGVNFHRHAIDWTLWGTIAYGHRPLQAALPLVLVWLIGLFVFAEAEARGAIKPNQPIVLRGEEWVGCAAPDPADRLACFLETHAAASYPAFNAAIYSIDTLLPIVDLEMQGYWIPDDRASTYGAFARGYLWLHIGLGWALSLLAVAGFSGLIRTDSKT